jgi:hypothetical protein
MSGADPARKALDERVLAWMRSGDWRPDEARFDAIARELFAFQVACCAPYARFCAGRGRTPERVTSWREIPPVPAGAFKELALRCFPAERLAHVFRSSGTAAERRGELLLDTLELYEASLLPSFERFVLPDLAPGARLPVHVLAPSPEEATDSSLSHMFGVVMTLRGAASSGFAVRGGRLDAEALARALGASADQGGPVLVCGTAFAFVHFLDELKRLGRRLPLPPGSRIMETGGFKGRSRSLSREALHGALADALGVPQERIVNQYGMTELGSQFYDSVLARPGEPRRKLGPPWARVRIVDPESGAEVTRGETGLVGVVDLANTGSVLAVQTADIGRSVADGFEVLGRAEGAEARGCSLAAEEMLSGGGRAA